MKKLALTLVIASAAIGMSVESFAQAAGPRGGGPGQFGQGGPGGPGGRRGGPGRMMEAQKEILAKLKLTADQKKKVEALDKKTQSKMEALRKDFKPGGDMSGVREKFRGVMEEHRKGMHKILDAKQKKQYQELMKAEMEKMRSRMGQGGPGGRRGPGGGGRPGAGGSL